MAYISKVPTVHIVSDGTPEHTRITMADGTELKHVRAYNITSEVGQPYVTVELEILATGHEIDGTVMKVEIICPLCQDSMQHKCMDGRSRGFWMP